MTDLLAGRMQMAVSLGFHIIFACIGMVMPFLMAAAHWRWLKTDDPVYLKLTKSWSKGVAIFFATGAVSGTVLSFELGLLWPGFMKHAGAIIGMPFSLEGTAFFIEAIALGLFLYGWKVMPRNIHFASGIVVGLSGVASGILVVAANGWMNSPAGFDWVDGAATNIDPWAAMANAAWFTQALHMTLAAFAATATAVAGVHAWQLLRHPGHPLHSAALKIALPFAAIAALLQPISGDLSAKDVAVRQPAKLAAMEGLYKTSQPADLIIGGIPNSETETVDYAIHLPGLLSFLAHGDFSAEVIGLDKFPKDEWPPVLIVHLAFQVMIAIGGWLMLLAVLYFYQQLRRKPWLEARWLLWLLAISTPLGFIAVEAGWIVTEVGRQPWIIYGIMKTADALTPMPGLVWSFYFTSMIYIGLSVVVSWLMIRQIRAVNIEYQRSEAR